MIFRNALITFMAVLASVPLCAQDILPGTRDPWQWPFDRGSIWNMPIGSGAEYKDAGFEAAGHVGVDIQIILELDENDPLQQAHLSTGFGPGRCDSTGIIDFYLPLPDTWIVPDAGNSPYGRTPNSNYAFRMPGAQSDTVHEGCRIARCVEGGPFYIPDWMKWPNNRKFQSITGDGMHGAGQGATGMSSLGGTLRKGELVGNEPIRHAVKINPWAEKYCHYSESVPGWKWPARRADGYAPDRYNREGDPDIVMGSLFAIPPDVTEGALDLATEPGKKLFFTLRNYGAYFTEDAAWDTWDLIVERDAETAFEDTYGFSMKSDTWRADVNKLMRALHVVTNNAPDRIGGGGTPLQPLAPDFGNDATGADRRLVPSVPARPAWVPAAGTSYDLFGRRITTGRPPRGVHVIVSSCSAGMERALAMDRH